LALAKTIKPSEAEGFVVADAAFRRVKIKVISFYIFVVTKIKCHAQKGKENAKPKKKGNQNTKKNWNNKKFSFKCSINISIYKK
jgi:hypothetical protein